LQKMEIMLKQHINNMKQLQDFPESFRSDLSLLAEVFPFKINNYVTEQLIDWKNISDDPIFRLVFPHKDMLLPEQFQTLRDASASGKDVLKKAVHNIHMQLNPHPAGQLNNLPVMKGKKLHGIQHKYSETVLFFPSQGQLCHAFCTYCFRWAQFIGESDLKIASKQGQELYDYVSSHNEVTDILFTGGDPMIMTIHLLELYIKPFLDKPIPHLKTIRIGTKALAYWPYRFTEDKDSDQLMSLFDRITASCLNLAIMAHFSHPKELQTEAVKKAVKRIQSTGAIIRCQAPLIKHINDDSKIWLSLWETQVAMGMVPYYMFMSRNTGAQKYFSVPLAEAFKIYSEAVRHVSGLGRTVRGPVMSCTAGKIHLAGIDEIRGEKVFLCRLIQSVDPSEVNRSFQAIYDEKALWIDDLKPAFGKSRFFFDQS